MRALAFIAVCTLALVAGGAVSARWWAGSRSERALALAAVALGIVLVSIHVLGWAGALGLAGALTPGTVATLITVLAGVAFMIAARGAGVRETTRQAVAALLDGPRLALDGLGECLRARSLAGAGLVLLGLVVAWTAYGAWLAPSSAWDGVFYHEAMIGFAIQNAGFASEALPPSLAPIDGYPRMVENLSLFGVMFLDRRVIELPGSPMLLVLVLGAYVLVRRWVPSRATAIGLASGLALLPGIVLQLRSTYIDAIAAAYFVIALSFVTRPTLRARDAVLAAVWIGIVGASKSTGFLLAPVLAAMLFARVLVRSRGVARIATIATGLCAIALLASPTYVRNWLEHDNPLWPGHVRVEALGIDWPGPLDVAAHDRSFSDTVRMLFAPPIDGQQYHDTRDNGYGNVPPFLILPLALLAMLVAPARAIVAWLGGKRDVARDALGMLAMVLPIVATLALSPAKFWARLNLHVVVALWMAAAWLIAKTGRSLGEGVVGALVVGGAITLCWSEPAWDIPWERVRRLASLSADERAVDDNEMITLAPEAIARERERLPAGALVVFAEHPFPAQLWNERFDNRVSWLPPMSPERWLDEAERRGATWVVVPRSGALIQRLRDSDEWFELGPGVRPRDVYVFARADARAK